MLASGRAMRSTEVRDVPLVPERDALHDRRRPEPGRRARGRRSLAEDRVFLVRHGRRALLTGGERLGQLAHLGALSVPYLERDRLADGRQYGEGATHSAMPSRMTTWVDTGAGARPSAAATRRSTPGSMWSRCRRLRTASSRRRHRSTAGAGPATGPPRRRSRRPGGPTDPARRGCRGFGRPASCRGARGHDRATRATSAVAFASSRSVASTSCRASAVSRRSEEVMPKCTYAAASRGEVLSAQAVRNAMTSCCVTASIRRRLRRSVAAPGAPGPRPRAAPGPRRPAPRARGSRPGTTARTCAPRSRP